MMFVDLRKKASLIWVLVFLIMGITSGCRKKYYPFSFSYSNFSEQEIFIESVRVLRNNVQAGGRTPGTFMRAGVTYDRLDCTPKALLMTPASFTWWEWNHAAPEDTWIRPDDESKVQTAQLAFPEFDFRADAWRCHYLFQADQTWVGLFNGVKAKPIGKPPQTYQFPLAKPDQPWIHFQFKNLTKKEIFFSSPVGKLVNEESEILLRIPNVAADNHFHGFAAHSHEGSIYRPGRGSKLIVAWGFVPGIPKPVEFKLPEFDPKKQNWYCYFILGEDEKWTTVFEGTYERKTDLDQ